MTFKLAAMAPKVYLYNSTRKKNFQLKVVHRYKVSFNSGGPNIPNSGGPNIPNSGGPNIPNSGLRNIPKSCKRRGEVKVKFSMARSHWRIYYHRIWGQLCTCRNLLKQPNWKILVAFYQNQLRTMASETVNPIDWSHPQPSWAVLPERLVHSINRCNLSHSRESTL